MNKTEGMIAKVLREHPAGCSRSSLIEAFARELSENSPHFDPDAFRLCASRHPTRTAHRGTRWNTKTKRYERS